MEKLQYISGFFNLFVGGFLMLAGLGFLNPAKTEESQRRFQKNRPWFFVVGVAIVFWGLTKIF